MHVTHPHKQVEQEVFEVDEEEEEEEEVDLEEEGEPTGCWRVQG